MKKTSESSGVLYKYLNPQSSRLQIQKEPFLLPSGINILLLDIAAGSHTPSLVSKVLQWRLDFPEDCRFLWNSIQSDIVELVQACTSLQKFADSIGSSEYLQLMTEVLYDGNSRAESKQVKLILLEISGLFNVRIHEPLSFY
jgi:phosphomevalonate kinase